MGKNTEIKTRLQKLAGDPAPGIPDRTDFGDLSGLEPGKFYDMVAQAHAADRAGLHTDYRIGDPGTGLLSWALPRGIPAPGEKRLAVQQPVHAHAYADFEGEIPEGYGKGTVTTERRGRILVTRNSPGVIQFTVDSRRPERYTLRQTGDRQWLLINSRPPQGPAAEKSKMQVLTPEEAMSVVRSVESVVQPKIDGALTRATFGKNLELFSPRKSAIDGQPIVYTEKVTGGRPEADPALKGIEAEGEVYGLRKGKAIPVSELSGILNSRLEKARTSAEDRKIQLRVALHNVLGDAPYSDKLKTLGDIAARHPEVFDVVESVRGPRAAQGLLDRVIRKRHPLTEEGIVVHPEMGPALKVPLNTERDVHITGFYPGEGSRAATVGGFEYSLEPGGPVAGRIGSGIPNDLLQAIAEDPQSFIGRRARVMSLGGPTEKGNLRAGRLLALHEDYQDPVPGVGGADTSVLPVLKRIKAAGDARDWRAKDHLTRLLMMNSPGDFNVDSRKGDILGLTHTPTGFRIHAPLSVVSDLVGPEVSGQ